MSGSNKICKSCKELQQVYKKECYNFKKKLITLMLKSIESIIKIVKTTFYNAI